MKLFIFFLFASMIVGSAWGHKPKRMYILPLAALTLVLVFGYYVLRMT